MALFRVFGICSILLALCTGTGCNEKPKNPVSRDGEGLTGAYQRSKDTADLATLESLKKAVTAYRAANGEFPKSLKDLEQLTGASVDIGKYDYDPASGAVGLKSAP